MAMPDWHEKALTLLQVLRFNCEAHQSEGEAILSLYNGLPAHYKALIYVIAHQLRFRSESKH